MSPEEINLAIHKLRGNKKPPCNRIGGCFRTLGIPGPCKCDQDFAASIPNYNGDLNAMHEAVQFLRYKDTGSTLWASNNHWLCRIVYRDTGISPDSVSFCWEVQNATAAQRAEALLRTCNAWKDFANWKN